MGGPYTLNLHGWIVRSVLGLLLGESGGFSKSVNNPNKPYNHPKSPQLLSTHEPPNMDTINPPMMYNFGWFPKDQALSRRPYYKDCYVEPCSYGDPCGIRDIQL